MPELPEVTVVVNGLNKKLRGLTFSGVEFDWPKGFRWGKYTDKDLKGAKVKNVERRGKVVVINCSRNISSSHSRSNRESDPRVREDDKTGKFSILIHLKLTGQLIYQDEKTRVAGGHPLPPLNLPSPNKSTRATFEFTNLPAGRQAVGHLYFNDLRKFGWVKFVPTAPATPERSDGGQADEEWVRKYIGVLGPDALEISFEDFRQRLKSKSKSRIKKLLMDQTFVSGIGNIYADESLWLARVHPARAVASLSDAEIKALYKGIHDAMEMAIAKGGSSANSFVGSGGEKGLFLSFARAYHMTGRPCARCGTLITRKKMDGRSAHFCPACQRLSP